MPDPAAAADQATPEPVWPVGQVAAALGIPAVTIRSWERRYQMEPAHRSRGLHRRYTQTDIARLRRMQLLIQQGAPPGDAARLSAADGPPEAIDETSGSIELAALLREADALRITALDLLLDGSLMRLGVSRTWTELVAPALRTLEDRFERLQDCTDVELVLARSFEDALGRYLSGRRPRHDGQHPILLVSCPQDRHTLPLAVLRAVLLEQSHPVLTLGPDAGAPAIVAAASRTSPRVVVLWSMRRQAGQAALRSQLTGQGFTVEAAGPGWPRAARTLIGLEQAAERLTRSDPEIGPKLCNDASTPESVLQ
ncbi:MerR family transcriptional regulator [Kribbella italica]